MAEKKKCFVIMGFGEKTDYETGRKLDLNKTYSNIIKPAVEAAGLQCIRADEVQHSGVIDAPMYENLFSADVVVADLSTGNLNAFYELGVRHALRPYSTIAIAEKQFKLPFDVNHVVVRTYEHLGKGIEYDEVVRFRTELTDAIRTITEGTAVDSPVYRFLSGLKGPELAAALGASVVIPPSDDKKTIGILRNALAKAKDDESWGTCQALADELLAATPDEAWALQQSALSLYKLGDKAKKGKDFDAAREFYAKAEARLSKLNPRSTADSETLGLWGALFKRRYELEGDLPAEQRREDEAARARHLDEAIQALQKGFFILNDYYNGINLAYLLTTRAVRGERTDAIADIVTARRVREKVATICEAAAQSQKLNGEELYWVLASAEEAWLGLGDAEKSAAWGKQAAAVATQAWMRGTTADQLGKLKLLMKAANARAELV